MKTAGRAASALHIGQPGPRPRFEGVKVVSSSPRGRGQRPTSFREGLPASSAAKHVGPFKTPPMPLQARNAAETHGFCAAVPEVRIHLPPAESQANFGTESLLLTAGSSRLSRAAASAWFFCCLTPRRSTEWEVAVERPTYDLTIFKLHSGKLTLKIYTKGRTHPSHRGGCP